MELDIKASHPRLYVDENKLQVIKNRMNNENYNEAVEIISRNKSQPLEAAFLYLITKDENYANTSISALIKMLEDISKITDRFELVISYGNLLHTIAMVYDWCYDVLNHNSKKLILDKVNYIIDKIKTIYTKKDFKEIVINYSEGQLLRDILAVSVAIYDEDKTLFLKFKKDILVEFINIRNFTANAQSYPQGVYYGAVRAGFLMQVIWMIDYMGENKNVFSNLIGLEPYYLIYMKRPDGKMFHDGDMPKDGLLGNYPKLFMHAASFYKDKVLHEMFIKESSKIDFFNEGISPTYINPIEFILFYDDTVGKTPVETLPLERFFSQPVGATIIRTGWDFSEASSDVVCYFKLGVYNYNYHQHLDSGQFQIYYKGYLAIDSGAYKKHLDSHDVNYHKRTIAHNCMVFKKNREKMKFKGRDVSNDGGQQCLNENNYTFNLLDMFEGGQKVGKFVAECKYPLNNESDIVHIRGGFDDAYGTKLNYFARSFLFIRTEDKKCPVIIVIVDKVKTRFDKSYLLHSLNKPRMLVDKVIIKEKGGKLLNTTVLPRLNEISMELIGGDSMEFYVDSMNFDVNLNVEEKKEFEAGSYRVEITSKGSLQSEIFLNVLELRDELDEQSYEVKNLEQFQCSVNVDKYNIYYLEDLCYDYEIESKNDYATDFIVLNARLGYYSIIGIDDPNFYLQAEVRNNIMIFKAPKGRYLINRIIM